MALSPMTAAGFARRLGELLEHQEVIFFLGAGCSISSDIPGAGSLVKDSWLPRLYQESAPPGAPFDAWLKTAFPTYDPDAPAASYGAVMEHLFTDDNQRQMEIERICAGKDPGFGYAVLARLMARANSRARIAVTTNFDDLLFDALYLFANARPLMIHHDSLAPFIRPSHRRPIVVKVHGDHLLAPKNLPTETASIAEELKQRLIHLLRDRTVIFMGYSGDDLSIANLFDMVPAGASSFYWLKRSEPHCRMRSWFESRGGTWVKGDFDEFMLLVLNNLDFGHPNEDRFKTIFQRYLDTYDALSAKISQLPPTATDVVELREAEKQVAETLPDWWKVALEARKFHENDPERAKSIYENGLEAVGESAPLLGSYAIFLTSIRQDHDRAQELYERAIAADPTNAITLGSYAIFLTDIRKDHDRAQELYERAMDADPTNAITLGSYANFLRQIRQDPDRAQEFYERAMDAEPTRATTLGNYAGFLLARGNDQRGLEFLRAAFARPDLVEYPALAVECWFYLYANGPTDERSSALAALKRLILGGSRSPGWDLSRNIERATAQGHPGAEWLPQLAAVIGDEAEPAELDDWAAWQAAE